MGCRPRSVRNGAGGPLGSGRLAVTPPSRRPSRAASCRRICGQDARMTASRDAGVTNRSRASPNPVPKGRQDLAGGFSRRAEGIPQPSPEGTAEHRPGTCAKILLPPLSWLAERDEGASRHAYQGLTSRHSYLSPFLTAQCKPCIPRDFEPVRAGASGESRAEAPVRARFSQEHLVMFSGGFDVVLVGERRAVRPREGASGDLDSPSSAE